MGYDVHDSIGGGDADRVNREIRDWSNPADLKKAIQERFPKWKEDKSGGKNRFEGFKKAILDREDWYGSSKGIQFMEKEARTGFAGRPKHRFYMVTDAAGKYLGKPENIKTYMRHGNVYGLNLRTGRRALIA